MMYLEDFLESIQDLPVALRDMLVNIRELDLVVQNAMDKKTKESEEFLRKAGRITLGRRQSVFESLMTDFMKILEDADEKINIAEKLENILVNCLRQLDREIARFKIQLDTDNPGITSTIEEKVTKSEVLVNGESGKTMRQTTKKTTNSRKKSSTSSSTISSVDEVSARKPTPILDSVQDKENVANNSAVPIKVETTVSPAVALNYDATSYCICKQVSYGEMIACDHPSCPYEWFHYSCVNLKTVPEGTWYCPKCSACKDSLPRN